MPNCDGCGKPLVSKDSYERPGVRIEIAPGREITVCRSSRYSGGTNAKSACLERARKAALVCPGCGEEWHAVGVCTECRRRLDQAKQADDQPLVAVCFHYGKLMPYLRTEDMDRLGDLLTAAVQGRGARSGRHSRDLPGSTWGGSIPPRAQVEYSGSRVVEVTEDQKAAILALAEEIFFLMQAQWNAGYNAGHNLLHGLAVGRVSADDYRDALAKESPR